MFWSKPRRQKIHNSSALYVLLRFFPCYNAQDFISTCNQTIFFLTSYKKNRKLHYGTGGQPFFSWIIGTFEIYIQFILNFLLCTPNVGRVAQRKKSSTNSTAWLWFWDIKGTQNCQKWNKILSHLGDSTWHT